MKNKKIKRWSTIFNLSTIFNFESIKTENEASSNDVDEDGDNSTIVASPFRDRILVPRRGQHVSQGTLSIRLNSGNKML